jgi:Carboxypeptidase regulatory-like domain
MSSWMKLESTRSHQVAIAGQVSDKETGLTIGNAIVEITAMPEKFQTKRSLQALQYGSEWETLSKRCDRTTTANDGFFYFIDLPPGEYTLTAFLPGAATRYKLAQTTVTFPPLPKAGRFHSPKNEDFGRGSAPVPTPPHRRKIGDFRDRGGHGGTAPTRE